jgi:hypothetical protein
MTTIRTPGYQVIVDGIDITTEVAAFSVNLSLESATATASIECISRPLTVNAPNGMGENNTVQIWAGWGGSLHQVFGGFVDGTEWSWDGGSGRRVVFPCRDKLAITKLPWGRADLSLSEDVLARVYENQMDQQIVQNLVEAYGISSGETNIEGGFYTFGGAEPVILPVGTPGWSLIAELDALVGYATFTTRQGTIFRRPRYVLPASAESVLYAEEGDDLLAFRRRREIPEIVRQLRVRGLVIDEVPISYDVYSTDPDVGFWLPDPPGTVTRELQSNLIDDALEAQDLGDFWITELDKPREQYEVDLEGFPLINPADRIDVYCPSAEFDGAFLVATVSHRYDSGGFFTSVTGYQCHNDPDSGGGGS